MRRESSTTSLCLSSDCSSVCWSAEEHELSFSSHCETNKSFGESCSFIFRFIDHSLNRQFQEKYSAGKYTSENEHVFLHGVSGIAIAIGGTSRLGVI